MNLIEVERQKGPYGVFRKLEIIVDGVTIGEIDQGKTGTFQLPETSHQIWGKMDWGLTERLDLADYTPGKVVVFKAYFSFNLLRNLGAMDLPFSVFLRDETEAVD